MIQIGLVSDLHAEFWQTEHFNGIGAKVQQCLADADLILLAGDIDNGLFSVRTARLLFPQHPICLVAGNHEFYQHAYGQTLTMIKAEAARTNVHFLHRDCFMTTIDGRAIRVLGVTLWTDFAIFGTPDFSMFHASRGLNDYRLINNGDRKLTPHHTLLWHQADKAWLLAELNKPFDGLTIVMTHHAPVSFAADPDNINDVILPCFVSKLDDALIRAGVDLVCWGHTHYSMDRMIESTRFVSSQTGYPRRADRGETDNYGIIIPL